MADFWSGARARLSPGNTGSENTGMEMGAFVWAIGNLAYAPFEVMTSSPAAAVMGFGVGFTLAAMLYFTRLMDSIAAPGTP